MKKKKTREEKEEKEEKDKDREKEEREDKALDPRTGPLWRKVKVSWGYVLYNIYTYIFIYTK